MQTTTTCSFFCSRGTLNKNARNRQSLVCPPSISKGYIRSLRACLTTRNAYKHCCVSHLPTPEGATGMAQKRCVLSKILVGVFPGFHSVTQFACSQTYFFSTYSRKPFPPRFPTNFTDIALNNLLLSAIYESRSCRPELCFGLTSVTNMQRIIR